MLTVVALLTLAQLAEEPRSIGVFYYVSPAELVPLEKHDAQVRASRALGIGGVNQQAQIPGEKSSVRIMVDRPEFVLRLAPGIDPGKYQLIRFDAKGGKRVVQIMRGSAVTGSASTVLRTLPVEITRYGNESFRFVPLEPLVPGEYAFSPRDSNLSLCFGIDAKPGI